MYLNLLLISLLPIAVCIGLYFIDKYTKFNKLSYWKKQIIIGVIFGAIAVFGNEFGVSVNGANANVRDAAPLLAAFVFGGPSGIIAGCIGGIERFFAVYWHDNLWLTRWGCSISTILAGFSAAGLRKYFFEDKKPTWEFALASGIIVEVFHFVLVFITNMSDAVTILVIIKKLALPMIIAVGLATAAPLFVIQIVERKDQVRLLDSERLSNKLKWWLLGAIVFCYIGSSLVIYSIQTQSAYGTINETFDLTIEDVTNDVVATSNKEIKEKLDEVVTAYRNHAYDPSQYSDSEKFAEFRKYYSDLCEELNVYSIDIVEKDDDGKGIIVVSSDLSFDCTDPNAFYMTQYEGQSKDLHLIMSADDAPSYYIQDFRKRSDDVNGEIYLKYAAETISSRYYLVISLSEDYYKSVVEDKISAITSYRHVKNLGHILILDRFGNIVSDETELNQSGKSFGWSLKRLLESGSENTRLRGRMYGEDCFYKYVTVETYTLVIVLPYDDVMSDRDSSFMLNSFMMILSFAVLYFIIYRLLEGRVVKKVDAVNQYLDKITNGNLDVVVSEESCLEFKKLSSAINYSVNTLKRYIDEAAKRIDDELAFAKTIQLSALPSTFPAFPDKPQFDLYATMNTAKEVGGDFYDFYITDENHLAFLIADVSGKGIPAAMFMMEGKAMLKNFAKVLLPADEVLTNSNDGLSQNNEANMFITCWFGILDYRTGHVTFANAGHNYPLIYRKDSGWEYLKQKKNIVLGALEGTKYVVQEFDLNPGDKIYLYTDGVTEANNKEGKLYGEERLQNYLNANKELNLKEMLVGVQSDIDLFADGADQFDDITMVALEYIGNNSRE